MLYYLQQQEDIMKAPRSIRKRDGQAILCPYFNKHYGGCLSANMHGLTLASVVDHCGSHYTACVVYQKFTELSTASDCTGPIAEVALENVSGWSDKQNQQNKKAGCPISRRCSA